MKPEASGTLVVAMSRRLSCPASQVWQALNRPRALETMHPFVARHETPDLPLREGAEDEVVYHSGRRLRRRYVAFEENRRGELDVTIEGLPGEPEGKAHVVMELDDEDGGCRVRVTITSQALEGFREMQERMTRQYLDQMLRGFAFFCETGNPVRRNQFGSHPFYSPGD